MSRFGAFIAGLGIIATATAASYAVLGRPQLTYSQTAGGLSGYAWSETIGWIEMDGIDVDVSGNMSGYGWSENIGWVSAEPADLAGCPDSSCVAAIDVNGDFSGWLRALAADSNGWDGWISLDGVTLSIPDDISGYAWGSDVVGWVDFQNVTTDWSPCTPTFQCVDQTNWEEVCGAVVIDSGTCTDPLPLCSPGSTPCIVPADATGFLTLSPQLVPTGNTTEVTWDVEGTVSCVVTSDQAPPGWVPLAGDDEDTQTSHEIEETTVFTLTCTNELGEDPAEVDTATAVVVPTWVER